MNKKQSLFHIAKRDALPWYKSFAIRGCAIVLALIACAVVTMLMTGENPVSIYATIFKGAFGSARKTWVTFQNLAVLLGISLAVTPAFKMRFWNIGAEGQVLIDGRDARERSQLWLHSNIGYVLQTPHLFSGTVLENLRYGKPDATMEEIQRAVEAVSAQGIIERLPKGYDSAIGEGGSSLSTGEKQLLSFARALLADPRIFVLDEATSSVDTVTERLIQDAIEKVMAGRTSFVIAHRLSTIRRSDVILVVQDGKIVESGSHAQLMAKKGAYWQLYTRQYREEQLRTMMGQ